MLKIHQMDAKTLTWWYAHRDQIDMSPPYQRSGRIWSLEDKAFLIDSIINGFDIPKIYLADFTFGNTPLNTKQLSYAVIDGKQRLEAIVGFFENRVPLNQDFEYLLDRSVTLGGLTYRDLAKNHPRIAMELDNFNLSVMSVITDEESNINELFVRLNRSKPLVGAETRNAMRGEAPKVIRELAEHAFFSQCVRFSRKRSQEKNAAAKLLLLEFLGKFGETKKRQLDELVRQCIGSEAADIRPAFERVKQTLDVMTTVFSPEDQLLRSQGPVVLYYELVKLARTEHVSLVRPFLVKFEAMRAARRSAQPLDGELLTYDVLLRSINNTASQVKCFAILSKRFREYVAAETGSLFELGSAS